MFLYRMNLGNKPDAIRFVEEANKNVKSLLDERFDEQYDVSFGYQEAFVTIEYDTYQGVLDDYIEQVCKKLGLVKTEMEYVDSYEFHKIPTAY